MKNKEKLQDVYINASEETREALREIFGDDTKTLLPVTDRIQTIDDAYEETGRGRPDWEEVVKIFPELEFVKDYLSAQVDASVLAEAYNEGEKMGCDGEKRHYLPFFNVSRSGFAFYTSLCAFSYPYAGCSARLAFKNDKLARHAGKKFTEVYKKIIKG